MIAQFENKSMGILANTIKHVFTINKTSVYAWV
jgi:hypothetical protein